MQRRILAAAKPLIAVLAAVLMVAAGVFVAPPAFAGTFSISGTVYAGTTATPVGAGEVNVRLGAYPGAPTVPTAADGTYSFTNLDTGYYYLYFDYVGPGNYPSMAWYDAPIGTDVTPIRLDSFQNNHRQQVANITLPAPTSVSGNIFLVNGPGQFVTAPTGAAKVYYQLKSSQYVGGYGPLTYATTTGSSGTYSIPNLLSGVYKLYFEYIGAAQYQNAYYYQDIIVRATPMTGLSSGLNIKSSISGHFYLGNSSTPAGAGDVTVSLLCGNSTVATVTTAADGSYSFSNLNSCGYRVSGEYTHGSAYQTTWAYADGWGAIVRDVVMPPGFGLSGHVDLEVAGHSAGAGEVAVSLWAGAITELATVYTDASGNYSFNSIGGGDYFLKFHYLGTEQYPDWFLNASTEGRTNPLTFFTVDADTTGKNVTMGSGAAIAGTVTDSAGNPLAGQTVYADAYAPSAVEGDAPMFSLSTITMANGTYKFRALRQGFVYTVDFGGDPAGEYAFEAWDDLSYYYVPDEISIAVGDTTLHGGVSAELEHPATISGTVAVTNAPSGFTLDYLVAEVLVLDPSTNVWVETGDYYPLDALGHYSIPGLKPGSYRVAVFNGGPGQPAEIRSGVLILSEGGSATYSSTLSLKPPTIAEFYDSLGGATGPLGLAVSGVANVSGGSLQHFANGSIYSSLVGGTQVVWAGPIREQYWAANSIFGVYGWPIGPAVCPPYDFCYQDFENYSIQPYPLAVDTSPMITGPTVVGGTLTVSNGVFSPAATSYTYAWYRDGVKIVGATSARYVPTSADLGHTLTAEVTGRLSGWLPSPLTTNPTLPIRPSAASEIAALYASTGGSAGPLGPSSSAVVAFPNNGGGSLQHFVGGSIYSSNHGTWVVLAGPIRDKYFAASSISGVYGWPNGPLSCDATSCSQGFQGGQIFAQPTVVVTPPSITGVPQVGGTLTALNGTYAPPATSFTYRWLRNGTAIAGATAKTYVLVVADQGQTLTVEVTAKSASGMPVSSVSSATAAVAPTAAAQIAALRAANPSLGAAISAVVAFPNNGGGSLQHFANGSIYSSNLGGTWVVPAGPIRDAYWAASSITGMYQWPTGAQDCASGNCTQTFVGGTISASPLAITTLPSVGGTSRVGGTLVANPGTYSPAAQTHLYSWFRDGVRIAGATAPTLALTAADETHTFQVEVTASRTGSVSVTNLSVATAPVGPSAASQIATLRAANPSLGAALSAVVAFPNNGGGSLQHFANGSIYSSNLGGTWIMVAGPIRDQYWAASSISGVYGWPKTAMSCNTTGCAQLFISGAGVESQIRVDQTEVSTVPVISGAAMVGGTLTVSKGTYIPAATAFSYRWFRDGVQISGATGATYVLVAADQGKAITAIVTARSASGTPVDALSAATPAILPSAAAQIATLAAANSGQLGAATSGVVAFPDNGGGSLQHFANGSIYSSYAGGTWMVFAGGIREQYWAASSIFGVYKWPTGAQTCSAGTCTQTFVGGTISAAALALVTSPSLSGAARVGGIITVNPGTYSAGTTTFVYRWYRDGTTLIAGATGATYVPVAADQGHTVQAEVTASRVGSAPLTNRSGLSASIGPSAAAEIAALYAMNSMQLGSSVSAVVAFPDNGGGSLQHYQNGSIYSSNVGGTWIVWAGTIRTQYWNANSIFGVYKWPTGVGCVTGCTQTFVGGNISG